MSTKRVDDYVKRLKRRMYHLEDRIEGRSDESSSWDRAEISALKFAINYIEATPLEAEEFRRNRGR